MIIKKDISALMAKEMDRKEFLKHLGVGIIALSGVAAVVKTLGSIGTPAAKPQLKVSRGYGSSAYGGKGQS